jgi:hypothetical protein
MSIFKKTFLIAFTALIGYWLVAGFFFSYGQLLFHVVSAIVAGAFATKRILEYRNKQKWLAVIIWPVAVIIIYKTVDYIGLFTNWTLDFVPFTQLWNCIRFLDLTLASLVVATIATLGQRLLQRKNS